MKQYTLLSLYLLILLCFSCEEYDRESVVNPQGDELVIFRAATTGQSTRANTITPPPSPAGVLDNWDNLRIIAPGYGTGATNQSGLYSTDAVGNMDKMVGNDDLRWSARNMLFTSWYEGDGAGWTIDKLGGTGTVDFSKNLEMLIGASKAEDYKRDAQGDPPSVELTYKHLVAKVEIVLRNVAEEGKSIPAGTTITFPAIKQIGTLTAELTKTLNVSLGSAGNELGHTFEVEEGIGKLTCYMPPMTANELLMYGSFTVREGGTTTGTSYVGTLQNLDLGKDNEGEDKGFEAGWHYKFEITVNNDHTALLQAVTLAPWEVYPKNIYNRPSKGIWGLEDLQALSKFINREETTWNNLTMEDLVDDKGVINLYTDIAFKATDEFAPIGKTGNPFVGYEFNGNGYTISNFTLKDSEANNQGLFGLVGEKDNTNNTTIKNLTVSQVSVEGKNNIGALVGQTEGANIIIDHCFVNGGTVQGEENTGGVIGFCGNGTTISNCGATPSTVTGTKYVGGFVGQNNGTIGNSYSQTGSIICSGEIGGGFIGQNSNVVRNCYSSASFSYGLTSIGAFAGHHIAGTKNMESCHWNTECINNTTCSKVVGNSKPDDDGVEVKPGGFSGHAFNKSNGHIIQTGYSPLYDHLNNYIDSNSGNTKGFLRWARISGVALPVFAY